MLPQHLQQCVEKKKMQLSRHGVNKPLFNLVCVFVSVTNTFSCASITCHVSTLLIYFNEVNSVGCVEKAGLLFISLLNYDSEYAKVENIKYSKY